MPTELPSMSALTGWWMCAAWEKDRRPPGPPAKLGKATHACLETYLAGEVPDLTALAHVHGVRSQDFPVLQSHWRAIQPWASERRARGARPEQAFAVDVVTGAGRFLGERLPQTLRAYATPTEMVGASDVVEYDGAIATCTDLKTGRSGPMGAEEQLRALGYAIAAASPKVKRVRLRVLTPNAMEHDMGEMDCIDQGAFRWELRAAAERPKVPRAGGWCETSYCAGRLGSCAAYGAWKAGAA